MHGSDKWAALIGALLFVAATALQASPGVRVELGPPEIIYGPTSAVDGPIQTLWDGRKLAVLMPDWRTVRFEGSSLETVFQDGLVVTDPWAVFDTCGRWMQSVRKDGDLVRGWYHAETNCDYPVSMHTQKSIAYAESQNFGLNWTYPNYPANQVITAPPDAVSVPWVSPEWAPSEGDHTVLQGSHDGGQDYLFMWFLAGRDWKVHLARSSVEDGGVPGTWWKLYDGDWTEPGVGGRSDPIATYDDLAMPWGISWNSYLRTYIGWSKNWPEGYGLSTSPDGVTWNRNPYLMLRQDDNVWIPRGLGEITHYMANLSLSGTNDGTGREYWIYYSYVPPEYDLLDRYLVRRKATLVQIEDQVPAEQVHRVPLITYKKGHDLWTTTLAHHEGYEPIEMLGYIYTDQIPGSALLYDCEIRAAGDDHMVSADPECEHTDRDVITTLRTLGAISTEQREGYEPVYRCYQPDPFNHWLARGGCGNAINEGIMGYVEV